MLTRFFAISKPINYTILAIATLIYFLGHSFFEDAQTDLLEFWAGRILILLVFLFTLGVLNFIVKRNTLTQKNTYILFFFCCFVFAIPSILSRPYVVFSGLFVFLALRRIISMRSYVQLRKKIFDSAFWLTIASLFYFWNILFLAVLYLGILFYARDNYKNWLIPLVGIFVVVMLCVVYAFFAEGFTTFLINYLQLPVLDFEPYAQIELLLPISVFLSLYVWCVIKYLFILKSVSKKLKPSYGLILISSIIALIIAIFFAPKRDGGELYFLLGPLAIIVSRYVEKNKGFWFNEMIMWLCLSLPIILLFIS